MGKLFDRIAKVDKLAEDIVNGDIRKYTPEEAL